MKPNTTPSPEYLSTAQIHKQREQEAIRGRPSHTRTSGLPGRRRLLVFLPRSANGDKLRIHTCSTSARLLEGPRNLPTGPLLAYHIITRSYLTSVYYSHASWLNGDAENASGLLGQAASSLRLMSFLGSLYPMLSDVPVTHPLLAPVCSKRESFHPENDEPGIKRCQA